MDNQMRRATLKCRIERSPFSDERIFTLALPDGGEHVGAASYIYFTDRNGRPLGAEAPANGKSIQGMIEAILVRDNGDSCLLSLPDGSMVSAAPSAVKVSKEALPEVPVEP